MTLVGSGILLLFFGAIMAIIIPAILIWVAVRAVGFIFSVVGLGTRTIRFGGGSLIRFVKGMLNDIVSLLSGLISAALALVLGLTNILILRGKAVKHYFTAVEDESVAVVQCAYRLAIGHPLRLFGMGPALSNIEQRLPSMITGPRGTRQATSKVPTSGSEGDGFEGYSILSQLPTGGSGALLHVARPTPEKADELRERGISVPDRVVIKAFSLVTGSTLPQIVRESRALEAAGRLGLVLEHRLDESAFHYVMPFVAGVTLDVTAAKLHEQSGNEGLGAADLNDAICHSRDLARILGHFHSEGLWHKDIKPSNLIVGPAGLHVVDLGLVTPLASAMTLTTHGTEYYRDPELVRLAMKGVKVHQVDGAKFDIYGSGAVLYTLLENSFPAHGSLSRFNLPSPKALQFVVRKAMADMDSRYEAASHMAQDLEFLLASEDLWSVQPAQLPSYRGTLPAPVDVSHRAPSNQQAPYHTPGGTDWVEVVSKHTDAGPATSAAHAAGWNSPPISRRRSLNRNSRRRRRRGVLKSLALAGLGVLSAVFYLALFTQAFQQNNLASDLGTNPMHEPSIARPSNQRVMPQIVMPQYEIPQNGVGSPGLRSEGEYRTPQLDDPDGTGSNEHGIFQPSLLQVLSALPHQSSVLVAGPNTSYASTLREELIQAGLLAVALDTSISVETRREWMAGVQVQLGSGLLSDEGARVRVIAWQQVSAPGLDALIWVTGNDPVRAEVIHFEEASDR
jgi:serine/threonine protein kinase